MVANERYEPVSKAVRRFVNYARQQGGEVMAWPLSDTSFNICTIEADGAFVSLLGYDSGGKLSTMVLPLAQLAIQMSLEPAGSGSGPLVSSTCLQERNHEPPRHPCAD